MLSCRELSDWSWIRIELLYGVCAMHNLAAAPPAPKFVVFLLSVVPNFLEWAVLEVLAQKKKILNYTIRLPIT